MDHIPDSPAPKASDRGGAALTRRLADNLIDAQIDALLGHVGHRVRSLRQDQRLSRRELSERSGVSARYLAQLEGGEGNISIGLLKRVSLALDISLDQLLGEGDPLSREAATVAGLYRSSDAATRTKVMQILDPERLRAHKAERICLVGLRGAGKTTLGTALAQQMSAPFIELNKLIEQNAGMPVGEIIALYGQEGYRELEASALGGVVDSHRRVVLAVAGGIVADQASFATVLGRFHTIWVKAPPSEHMERVRAQGDLRPMAGNPQAMQQLMQILKSREALYGQADHVLDTGGKLVEASKQDLRQLVDQHRLLTAA